MNASDIIRLALFAVMGAVFVGIIAFAAMSQLRGSPGWTLVDATGNAVSPTVFRDVGPFRHGLAPAKTAAGWGYIGTDGEWAIEPQFANAEPFDARGYAQALSRDTALWGLLTTDGSWVIEPRYQTFSEVSEDGLVVVRQGIGVNAQSGTPKVSAGLYDLNAGDWRVAPREDDDRWTYAEGPVSDGRLVVQQSGRWSIVDLDGHPIGMRSWDRLWAPQGGRIRAQQDGNQGFVDRDGNPAIRIAYGPCSDMVDGVAVARTQDGSVLIDADGMQRGPVFEDLMTPAGGLVGAQAEDGTWGFVDLDGEWVIDPQWSAVGDEGFASGIARVGTDEGLLRIWQWIDRNGQTVGARADRLSPFADDRGFMQRR